MNKKEQRLFSEPPANPKEGQVWTDPKVYTDRATGQKSQVKYQYQNGQWIYVGVKWL